MTHLRQEFDLLAEGAILGLTVGDALGVPVEFVPRQELRQNPVTDMLSGGTYDLPAGTWSDDTSMTLCLMDSLTHVGIDYKDQMRRFAGWLCNASNTARDEVFDVGGTTRRAIMKFVDGTPALNCGEYTEHSCGNGSLMRILPLALYLVGRDPNATLEDATAKVIHNTSMCTHAHIRCQMACGIYCSVVFHLCRRNHLHDAVIQGITSAFSYYQTIPGFASVYPDFDSLPTIGSWTEDQIKSGGYVLDTLQAALWCLLTTDNYKSCVCKAVNLGKDTDTTAAVAGGLAGLWYGINEIPQTWANVTAKFKEIQTRCHKFSSVCLSSSAPL